LRWNTIYKKILVGVDESEDAIRAAKKALEYQKPNNAEVVVFHSVVHKLSEVNPSFIPNDSAGITYTIHQDFVNAGKEVLKKVEEMFKEGNGTVETRMIYDKEPQSYIIEAVEKEGFDLVVLGVSGKHSKLKRMIGTIPGKVINDASCDVLVVR